MSSESQSIVDAIPICQECRAQLPVAAKFCWLCGKAVNSYPPPMNQFAPSTTHNQQQSSGVLWALVAAATFGTVHLIWIAPTLVFDPVFVAMLIPLVVIALTIVALIAQSARRAGRPWRPEKAAAISILGVLTAVGVAIVVTMVVVVALLVAFVITCGGAGRLPS